MQASVHVVMVLKLLFQQHCGCVEAARMLQHSQAARTVQVRLAFLVIFLVSFAVSLHWSVLFQMLAVDDFKVSYHV
jgi:hypothetical protein